MASIELETQKPRSSEMELFDYSFDEEFVRLGDKLDRIAEKLTKKWDLPIRGIIAKKGFGRSEKLGNKGKIISYMICANEPAYPATDEEMKDENRTQSQFLSVRKPKIKKWQGCVEICLGLNLSQLEIPSDAVILSKDSNGEGEDDVSTSIIISPTSNNFEDLITQIVELRLKWYSSSADPFGCCDMFNACSDAKKCIHENRFYSTACAYRHNLEQGRIFYGKNRNI